MKLLILGGTEFVGRAVTEDALARGWDVTVFHRGNHAPPPGVTALHGDRVGDLSALADAVRDGARWDVVLDTWSGAPAAVREAAQLLADHADRYVYVSSRSVYADPVPAHQAEDGVLVEPGDEGYAHVKRGGEKAAVEVFGEDRCVLVRAGLIVGPGENIGRLPWWLNRIALGGPVLAPGPRDLPLQYIDARDLAVWMLDAAEQGLSGPYNLISPQGHATMGELLDSCVRATGATGVELRWAEPELILSHGIVPWMDLPVWVPPGEDHDAIHRADVTKAVASGLRCRPVAETVADTWAWLGTLGGVAPQRTDRPVVGLAPDIEAKVLAALGS
ncbi:NAD-dependent epimerase/dehydratase family protein [Streptomyces sp. NBC_00237]|uniref:NAD-dependent epimerase/dehydratase family protein n=1 Tax=Streptomyces sp. NBC_00237 TaxID=2975687 RepID=UPI00225477B2|nr:NAD-dependent epimerase/dehydratase family protein [Streptomyces sp. NBC_00237]MCX5203406.1 NAD-dependent epimerase/dehydratase family protein [Streptomyces sp. NBC_00237]